MWRELVAKHFDDAKFNSPASDADIQHVERAFGITLPDELRNLLLESNGVSAHYSSPLVWTTDEMVEQNRLFREQPTFPELYMPFDCLFFFGAEGNGDQFFYRVLAGQIRETSIYKWDHEGDDRLWFANNVADYIRRSVPKEE
jgi:hypothetical protein